MAGNLKHQTKNMYNKFTPLTCLIDKDLWRRFIAKSYTKYYQKCTQDKCKTITKS